MHDIAAEQIRRNRESRDSWRLYAEHRRQVMALLSAGGAESGRLCVLGAGNCNDLDLPQLTQIFSQIDLFDIDPEALAAAASAQRVADHPRLCWRAPTDVSSVGEFLPTDSAAVLLEKTQAVAPLTEYRGAADIVLSACLLTQLIETCAIRLGQDRPDLFAAIDAVRRQHLRLLLDLTRPGGRAILVTDFVSSTTCPEMAEAPAEQIPQMAMRLIRERNFFTGANPFALRRLFLDDPHLAPLTQRVRSTTPWRWRFADRAYLVCAIEVRKTQ